MFCINCGKEHQDDMSFCPYCGKPTGSMPAGSHAPNSIVPAKKNPIGLIIAIIAIAVVLVAGAVVAAIFLFRGGDNPLSDYMRNPKFQEMRDLEDKMTASYNSVSGANFESDEKMLTEFKEHTIVYARDLYTKSVEITDDIEDEEVLGVHREYINYVESYSQAVSSTITALQAQDASLISQANKEMAEANNHALDYARDIKKLGEKYHVDINAAIKTGIPAGAGTDPSGIGQIGGDSGTDQGGTDQQGTDSEGFDEPGEPKADRSQVLQFVLYDKLDGAEEGDKVEVNLADVLLDGNEVQDAEAKTQTSQTDGKVQNIVSITFTEEGAKIFGEITADHVGEMLAIVSDGVLISAPNIKEAITGGECIISGGFDDFSEAEELARKLRG